MKLWMLVSICLLLAYFASPAENKDGSILRIKVKHDRSRLPMIAMATILIVFASLRTFYNDTGVYLNSYRNIIEFPDSLNTLSWKFGRNPGFQLFNSVLKAIGLNEHMFLLVYALIDIGIYIWFMRKYSSSFLFTIFLFFMTGCYTFALAAIKQVTATAICLIAIHFALKKRWIIFSLLVLFAMSFHAYSLIFALVPFSLYRPWQAKTLIIIFLALIAAAFLAPLVSAFVGFATTIGEEYTETDLLGDGVNIFRVAVYMVPVLISMLFRKKLFFDSTPEQNLFVNLSIMSGFIMFLGLFGTANYFARLANFFQFSLLITLPWIFDRIARRKDNALRVLAVICFCMFFIYESYISKPFDARYKMITLMELLESM